MTMRASLAAKLSNGARDGWLSPVRFGTLPSASIARQGGFHQRRLAVEHADIDAAALRILVALVERRQNSHRREQRRAQIAEAGADARGRPVGPARQAHDAAHRLHHHVVAGKIAERAAMAEAGDRGIDDVRMGLGQPFGAIAQPVHHAGAEILHHDIGFAQEALQQFAVARRLDVENDAFLAPVEAHEIGRLPVHKRAEGAGVVAGAELLDLDDARAQVGKNHRAIGPRQNAREIQNRDPLKGPLTQFFRLHHNLPAQPVRGNFQRETGIANSAPLPMLSGQRCMIDFCLV